MIRTVAPKLAIFGKLKMGRNEFCYKIFLLSLKVTPFNWDMTKGIENLMVGTMFLNFLKSAPKSPNFGRKSAIFDRFQKKKFFATKYPQIHVKSNLNEFFYQQVYGQQDRKTI